MLKELEFEEIQTFFNELDTKQNSKFIKARLYGMALNEQEKQSKENSIRELYETRNKKYADEIIIIDSNLSVIKATEKWNNEQRIVFYPVVNEKLLNCVFEKLYDAIIYGIACQLGCEDYFSAISKLIDRT